MKPLKINNSSEIKQILDKSKDISIVEEMGMMTYIYDLEQKVKGIDKVMNFMKKEELLPPDYKPDWDDYSWAFNSIASMLGGEDNE